MGLLKLTNVSYSFGEKILYKDAEFELFKGEHMGLIGKNGTGKTTLINMIVGNVIPDSGEIHLQKNISLGYLDQYANVDGNLNIFEYLKTAFDELYEIERELNAIYSKEENYNNSELMEKASDYQSFLINRGFYEIESNILKVADGLGVTALGMGTKMDELSGGQKAKVILSKLLLGNYDLLLLDEPTNFLDKQHVEWLSEYLKSFKGAFIVVSHDYAFLDKITTCILDIEFAKIKKYSGNLFKVLNTKELHDKSFLNEYNAQQKQIKKYEIYIQKNKARASTAAMAKSRQKQLDKIDRLVLPKSSGKINFKLNAAPVTDKRILKVQNLQIGYSFPILPALSFELQSDQKLVITGFNGIGKSTLLKTLVGELQPLSGQFEFANNVKIGYFEQDFKWQNKSITPIDIVLDKFPELSEKQIRSSLAQCGVNTKNALQPISTLSGGEQSKVKLCLLSLTSANFLILDEPTNHLDIDTKEVLKQELKNWQGGMILVSHEAEFCADWCDEILNIK